MVPQTPRIRRRLRDVQSVLTRFHSVIMAYETMHYVRAWFFGGKGMSRISSARRWRHALLGSAMLAGGWMPAAAQPTPAPAASTQIETVSVTARRRKEPLQKVPVAVSVIAGAQARQANLNNLQDIFTIVPAANFRTSSSNKDRTIFIRGIGTISTSPGVEPSVSTVLDGVVLARSGQATLDLVDLLQVEVLRGPQGTLFGKNASAGAVNITTMPPAKNFHAWADAGYFGGQGDQYRFDGGVTGTIAPNLTGIISALSDHWDGNVKNLFDDKEVNGYTRDGFRSKLQYQPDDDLKVTLGIDYLKSLDTVPNGVFLSPNREAYPTDIITKNPALANVLSAQGIFPGPNNTNISNNVTSSADDDNGGVGLTIEDKLGDYTFTSITAWRIWHNTQVQDYDQISAPPVSSFPEIKDRGNLLFNQVSEEARIASPKGGLIDYVFGLYYLLAVDNESYDRNLSSSKTPDVVSTYGAAKYGTDGNDLALFGEGNINFTDKFRGIFGLRIVSDDLSYTFGRLSSSPVAVTGIRPDFNSEGSTHAFGYTDRVGLQYDILPETTAYFTYSRGYKGPAYNVYFNMYKTPTYPVTFDDTIPLKPETNNSFDLGLKSTFLHDHVQADFAAFIEDFNDYQANYLGLVGGAIVTRLINAGAVSTRGFEGDITARPFRNFEFGGNFAFTDAKVDNFNCPPTAPTSCNINGEPLPFAPLWKLDSHARYTIPLNDDYNAILGTNFDWQTKTQYALTETPDTIQKAYGIWNADVTLQNFPDAWKITTLVKNILNTHYSSYLAYGDLGGVLRYVPRDDGRYYGIELHKDF
jgi:iron complex outermembrane receptor protein